MDWVYTADGLVVGFSKTPPPSQRPPGGPPSAVNITLWQLLIHGKKPIALKGARPDHIVLLEAAGTER